MSAKPVAGEKPYRWVEIQHEDLDFYRVPRPLPWPRGEDAQISPDKDFPFRTLLQGIDLLQADEGAQIRPVWKSLANVVNAGDDLIEALETSNLDWAEEILDRLDGLHPGCPFVYFNKAFVVHQRGDKKAAVRLYERAVEVAPNLEFLWMRLGEVSEELGRARQAIAAYRKAQALLAPHPQALEGLARLGAMKRLEQMTDSGEREIFYVTTKQFQSIMRREIEALAEDRTHLLSLVHQLIEGNDGALAVSAARKLLEKAPTDNVAIRLLGEAHRLARDLPEAEECLRKCLEKDPRDAWAHYYLAWLRFDQNDAARGWVEMRTALDLDPNLHPAIVCLFGLKSGQTDLQRETHLAEWSAQKRSWQGYLLASVQARERGDLPVALGYAAKAYEIAPDNQMVVLQYTGLLGQSGEKEWMAAVTKRHLAAGKGDYQVKCQFASALHDLGLKKEAINVLRETLAAEESMPAEWQESFHFRLDLWTGRIAESEVPLERYDSGVLRRSIVLVVDDREARELIPGGAPLPQKKLVQLALKNPGTSVSLCLQQGSARGDLEPLRLGCFRMEGIDPAKLSTESPQFRIQANVDGHLQVCARQGDRKLAVSWSLYPVPAIECCDQEGDS
jgi:tetratricopeptide (TPR) repeat protein